jgi:hypothetical protein
MIIEFKYQKHIDLIFHVLAHFKVNNASDLFSQTYIDKMQLERKSKPLIIPTKIIDYYNQNFERLAIINFLPFLSNDYNELKKSLLNYKEFNSNDMEFFINPFIELLDDEALFYFDYWEKECQLKEQKIAEKAIKDKLDSYKFIFDYYKKSVIVYFSISITRNGRGFGGSNNFSALIPFPKSQDEINNSFYTLLHEYTHQITDIMLKTNINMQDGSHSISENMVILFDYYIIKSVCEADLEIYFNWISKASGNLGMKMSEAEFLSLFMVSDEIANDLKELVNKLIHSEL